MAIYMGKNYVKTPYDIAREKCLIVKNKLFERVKFHVTV